MSKKPSVKPERTYKTMYTYVCPVRGKVTEEIEVKVYRQAETNHPMFPTEEVTELLRQEGVLPSEDF